MPGQSEVEAEKVAFKVSFYESSTERERERERGGAEGRERMASPVEMATSTTTRRGVEF